MKTTLKAIPHKGDPMLSAYGVEDQDGNKLGAVMQYWAESIRSTTRSATYRKFKRWLAVGASGKTAHIQSFKSRKEAVEFLVAQK